MSRLDELIAELCPDGVEYYCLSDLFDQFSGMGGVTNKWADEGNCRFIDYMNAYTHISIDVNDLPYATVKKLDQTILKKGDILFTSASETPDECAISSVIEDEIQDGIFLDDHLFGLRIKQQFVMEMSPSFLKYIFRSDGFRRQMKKAVRGVTRFYVSKPDFMKLRIPVPPLEVQREIVRVLDNFTSLTAELTAELSARRKQYEYYRNQLLTFGANTECKTLGDVCNLVRGPFGGSLKKECFVNDGYVVYEQQHAIYGKWEFRYHIDENKFNKLKRFAVAPGDLIMSCSGTMGRLAIIPEGAPEGVINQALLKITAGPDINRFYLKYFFENTIEKKLNDDARGGAIKNVASVGELKQIEIPIPSMDEQNRLVVILDNFEAICSDLSIGLPAEIEARQKQYEYYRDKLLTFKEKV